MRPIVNRKLFGTLALFVGFWIMAAAVILTPDGMAPPVDAAVQQGQPPPVVAAADARFLRMSITLESDERAFTSFWYIFDTGEPNQSQAKHFIFMEPWPAEGSQQMEALQALQRIYAAGGFLTHAGEPTPIAFRGDHRHGENVEDFEAHGGYNPFVPGSHERWVKRLQFEGDQVKLGVTGALEKHLGMDSGPTLHANILAAATDADGRKIRERRIEVLTWVDGHLQDGTYQALRSHAPDSPGRLMHMRTVAIGRQALIDQALLNEQAWGYFESEMAISPADWRGRIRPNVATWKAQELNHEYDKFFRSAEIRGTPGLSPRPAAAAIMPRFHQQTTEDDLFRALGYMSGDPTIVPVPDPADSN